MNIDTIKSKVFSNLIWRFAERCGAQGVSFIVSVVLARLLLPDDYGTVALVTVFTAVLQVFVDSGMGTALIQKKDADDIDFSTVFYFNCVVCILLYAGMFVSAPLVASFYNKPELTSLVRVISVTLLISGVKNIQQAYVSRNMLFKKFFYATIAGTIFSAVLGIIMAYMGFGVWALVVQQLSNSVVDTIFLWITVKWRPRLAFSFKRLKGLFSFGWKLLASAVLETVYNNIQQLVIGKLYSSVDLAYYNKGMQLPGIIINNINSSIDSVLLPAMSKEQDNVEHIKNMTKRSICTSIYIIAPLMIGLAFTAPVLVRLLLTDKWLEIIPFLRIFCIVYMFYPIHTANLNAISAMGHSGLFLKLQVIKKITGMVFLFFSMQYGVMAMAYSSLLVSFLSQVINSWPARKLLGYGYIKQMKDIMPSVLLSIAMGIIVSFFRYLQLPELIILAVQIITGGIFYISISAFFKLDSFQYLWKITKQYILKLFHNIKKCTGNSGINE